MRTFEKILGVGVLAAIVVGTPYLLAKYKAINYARGQVILPGAIEAVTKAEDSLSTTLSPDGKATLTEKKQTTKGSTTYTFTTDTGLTFTKTLAVPGTISIPFNTWSNDDKYIFLKEDVNGQTNYYVLSASGKTFADGSLFINLSDVFARKLPNLKLSEATGWAAPTLIVVNTTTSDGKEGSSFWFEITDQSFIQLSERFN